MSHRDTLHCLIDEIEAQLVHANLWQAEPIDSQALESVQPFAVDTMSFEQWLQFLFIPKMRILLDNQLPLPTKIAVAPMAEQVFCGQHQPLVEAIVRLDSYLTNLVQV